MINHGISGHPISRQSHGTEVDAIRQAELYPPGTSWRHRVFQNGAIGNSKLYLNLIESTIVDICRLFMCIRWDLSRFCWRRKELHSMRHRRCCMISLQSHTQSSRPDPWSEKYPWAGVMSTALCCLQLPQGTRLATHARSWAVTSCVAPGDTSHVLSIQVGRNGEDVESGGLGEVPGHSALPLRSNPAVASTGLSPHVSYAALWRLHCWGVIAGQAQRVRVSFPKMEAALSASWRFEKDALILVACPQRLSACLVLPGNALAGGGKCPFLGIGFTSPKQISEIVSPIVGWCLSLGHLATNFLFTISLTAGFLSKTSRTIRELLILMQIAIQNPFSYLQAWFIT